MSLTISLPPELEHLLIADAAREGIPVDELVCRTLQIHWATVPQKTEGQLLEQVNEGFPEGFWTTYNSLKAKLQEGALTAEERADFLALNDQVERRQAERLRLLSELAQRRGVSLLTLIEELGLGYSG